MSASVSKIPVAKHRRLSPERPSPAVSPQKSVSKLPIKVSKIGNISDVSVQRQFKENICDNSSRWSETSSPMTSPSRIPVMKSQPDVSEVVTPRHHDVTPRHHDVTPRHHDVTPHQQRPQSIDLEDEYISGRSYILSSSSHPPEIVPHQVRKMSDPKIGFSPQRKISPLAAQTTNSRIPIASEYYSRTDRPRPSPPRSTSSSSLKMSPVSGRLEREDSEKSLSRTRSTDYISADSGTSNEQVEWTPPKPRRSSAPSPPKTHIPVIGWSLQPERQEEPPTRNIEAEKASNDQRRTSAPPTMSTNYRPLESNDKLATNGQGRRKFEAFVMTGDRMINLAKTPANTEFRSKYYRGPSLTSTSVSVPNSPHFEDVEEDETTAQTSTATSTPIVALSESDNNDQVKWRAEALHRRSLARNSKSEDQLQMEIHDMDEDEDNFSNSMHALHNGGDSNATQSTEATFYSSQSSPQHSRKKSPPKNLFKADSSNITTSQTSSQDTESPDFSTSSLISCSEHYNGESVLDNISPKSPSSPDTPEWSLIDSFHKSKTSGNGKRTKQLSPSKEIETPLANGSFTDFADNFEQQQQQHLQQQSEAISSSGNRVVISINNTPQSSHNGSRQVTSPGNLSQTGSRHIMSPGGSSTGTITPEIKNPVAGPQTATSDEEEEEEYFRNDDDRFYVAQENLAGNGASPQLSESEESDMESLRSYHPPIKVVDIPSALRLAKRLYNLEGFKKSDVSRHLSRNNEFNQVVAEEYLKFFTFEGCGLDAALRQFLTRFCLAGETQERERVLLHFARRYVKCNPNVVGTQRSWFRSLDSVHTLTCAIMLLNTDLHGENLQRKMTCNEFIENLSELNDGQNFPKDLLKGIYYSIKQEAIPWAPDLEVVSLPTEPSSTQPQKPARINIPGANGELTDEIRPDGHSNGSSPVVASQPIALGQTAGGVNPFLSAPDQETAINYKKGYVMRKSCVDANGKRTKMGKRSWKMFFMTLRDMVLYCFKDEKSVRVPSSFDDLSQAIRIHHGLAVRSDHRKKQFVFRLYTADQAQYLFQTSDEKELLTWIDSINAVVASFSSPQLPAPCSSSFARFQRPLMPSSKSSLTFNDQLQSHERQLIQIREDLEIHQQNPLSRGTKGASVQAYIEKQEFLTFEIMRYETYILTLRTKNAHDA